MKSIATATIYPLRTTVRWCIKSLNRANRVRYTFAVVAQLFLSLADIAGVIVLALLIANLSGLIDSGSLGDASSIGGALEQFNPLYVALAVGVLFVVKGLFAFLTLRWLFSFLASAQSSLASSIISRFFQQQINQVASFNTATVAFACLQGSSAATIGVLGSLAIMVSEGFLLVILGGLLVVAYPLPTISSALAMGLTLLGLRHWLTRSAKDSVRAATDASIFGTRHINETVFAFREFRVSGTLPVLVERIKETCSSLGQAQSVTNLIAAAPKFFLETALVLGVGVLFATRLAMSSLDSAATASAVCLVAGFRLLPSALRLLSASLTLQSSSMHTLPILELDKSITNESPKRISTIGSTNELLTKREAQAPDLIVEKVTFHYEPNSSPTVNSVSLRLESGNTLAIVGSSGSGNSTLIDLILGLLEPQSGSIHVGSRQPTTIRFPDAHKTSYVPRHVGLVSGSLIDNLLVGLDRKSVSWENVQTSLEIAHIWAWTESLAEGLDTQVGERGAQLSGGQRQRLGIGVH